MVEEEATRSVGRPTKYDPAYCEKLVDHMAAGFSFESFAGTVGVTRSTLYEWESKQAAFSDAKQRGVEKCRVFWEAFGVRNLLNSKGGAGLNTGLWIFNMKNRFPAEWRERQEIAHGTVEDKPLNVRISTVSTKDAE